MQWQSSYILDDNSTPTPFFNKATGKVEQWQRKYFTIEENEGFGAGEIHNHDRTISLNGGLKGTIANSWLYELGIDQASGLNIYDAPHSRFYTPLTVAQFRSITQDSVDNELTNFNVYTIPRYKGSYSGTWNIGRISATLHGALIGGLPDYNGDRRLASTTRYNASVNYRLNDRGSVTFIVDNLFDSRPQQDPTWTSYPYYASNWFDPIGRAFFVQLTYRLGGHAP